MTQDRDHKLQGEPVTIDTGGTRAASDDSRGKYSEEEYDAALAQIFTAERVEIEDDFARGRTYTLDEWLQDDD